MRSLRIVGPKVSARASAARLFANPLLILPPLGEMRQWLEKGAQASLDHASDTAAVLRSVEWAAKSPQSLQLIDSSIIRAHQRAAGGKKGTRITPSAVLVED